MFTKIFLQIFDSSIADTPDLRHFFMDMLVLADKHGIIDMTETAIAARTRLPVASVIEWLHDLEQPDPKSRSKVAEGRRLIPIDPERGWGWKIVNYSKYRANSSQELLRAAEAKRVADYRKRKKENSPAPLKKEEVQSTDADADAEESRTCTDMYGQSTATLSAAAASESPISHDDWIASFRSKYPLLNLKEEYRNCDRWFMEHRHRHPTRDDFESWLSKAKPCAWSLKNGVPPPDNKEGKQWDGSSQ